MKEAKRGKPKYRSNEQKGALYNTGTLCKSREAVIKFFNDYSLLVSEAKHEATNGKGLKVLFPKQMFQRLPIQTHIKAGNNSENLLSKIKQIFCSLY